MQNVRPLTGFIDEKGRNDAQLEDPGIFVNKKTHGVFGIDFPYRDPVVPSQQVMCSTPLCRCQESLL